MQGGLEAVMAKMETLTVDVPAELVEGVRNAVAGGEYRSDAEAVSDALAEWNARREGRYDAGPLREAWQEAEASVDCEPMDAMLDRLKAKYVALYPDGSSACE
jgi:Arc/MetJ-type ribon-helix-helix transcriptional regulator